MPTVFLRIGGVQPIAAELDPFELYARIFFRLPGQPCIGHHARSGFDFLTGKNTGVGHPIFVGVFGIRQRRIETPGICERHARTHFDATMARFTGIDGGGQRGDGIALRHNIVAFGQVIHHHIVIQRARIAAKSDLNLIRLDRL